MLDTPPAAPELEGRFQPFPEPALLPRRMPGIVAALLALAFWLQAAEVYVREHVDDRRAATADASESEAVTARGIDALSLLLQSELDDSPTRRSTGTHAATDSPFRVALLPESTDSRLDDSRSAIPRHQPALSYDATAPPALRPELRSH